MSSRLEEQLPSMFALAHERNDDARVQLAGMIADIFLVDEAQLTDKEENLVNELIDQLMQTNNPSIRRMLVERFADSARMPRRMAMSLACDSIDQARAVLTSSKALTDNDLITVIESQTRDHAKAVATRQKISEAVSDALVVTGDIEIMQVVAENLGAKLTPRAIDLMTKAARFASDLREPLVHRPEMSLDSATRLYWWVSQDLRRYMLKRFGIVSGQVNEALNRTIEELLGDHELQKNNDDVMAQVADWLGQCHIITPKILPQVLRLGHFRLFNILLSRLTGLDLATMDLIVESTGSRALAVVCRGLMIEKATFVSIFLLSRGARPGEQIVHPRELSFALGAFDRLTPALARDLLKSWQKDPSYLKKHQKEFALE